MVMQLIVLFGNVLLALLLAPLTWGMSHRVKCWFEGRRGPGVLQMYFDIFKEMRKSGNYSATTTPVFRFAPVMGFCTVLLAAALMPAGGHASWLGFSGDIFLLIALLSAGRFWVILGALDTGEAVDGMGASRDVFYAVMIAPAFFLSMAALAVSSGGMTLHGVFDDSVTYKFGSRIMVVMAFLLIYMVENARMPFEDPNSKFEAPMIKYGMLMDYSGPELGLVVYSMSLKTWLFGSILVLSACPVLSALPLYVYWPVLFIGVTAAAMGIGVVETIMARLSLRDAPQYLLLGYGSALLALIFLLFR